MVRSIQEADSTAGVMNTDLIPVFRPGVDAPFSQSIQDILLLAPVHNAESARSILSTLTSFAMNTSSSQFVATGVNLPSATTSDLQFFFSADSTTTGAGGSLSSVVPIDRILALDTAIATNQRDDSNSLQIVNDGHIDYLDNSVEVYVGRTSSNEILLSSPTPSLTVDTLVIYEIQYSAADHTTFATTTQLDAEIARREAGDVVFEGDGNIPLILHAAAETAPTAPDSSIIWSRQGYVNLDTQIVWSETKPTATGANVNWIAIATTYLQHTNIYSTPEWSVFRAHDGYDIIYSDDRTELASNWSTTQGADDVYFRVRKDNGLYSASFRIDGNPESGFADIAVFDTSITGNYPGFLDDTIVPTRNITQYTWLDMTVTFVDSSGVPITKVPLLFPLIDIDVQIVTNGMPSLNTANRLFVSVDATEHGGGIIKSSESPSLFEADNKIEFNMHFLGPTSSEINRLQLWEFSNNVPQAVKIAFRLR